ncbi:hypothetical protein [Cellulomonas sp. URHD0024]|uniref:hypothetical protein n=1 Tax=Cellulomonas sp. URHD0024 TaxID=1302620 RepID=UPI000410771F|nr:hypothetical protein [Cellulomonas sp. URHD0024]
MRFTRFAAALGAVALVGAVVIAVAGPASAGGSHPSPSPSPTCSPSPGAAAWDETIVDHVAYTDPDTVVPDTWVVDTAASEETLVDHEAHWQRYSWVGGPIAEGVTPSWSGPADPSWQANTAGDPNKIGHAGAYDQGKPGHADWFYLEWVPAATHVVHHAEAGHWEHHPAIPGQHHDAVTHVVHHPATPPVTCPSPYEDTITVTPAVIVTPPTCDAEGSFTLSPESGVLWSAVDGNEPGSIVFTAAPAPGYAFPADVQTQFSVPNLDQLAADDEECYAPPQVAYVVPATPSVQDECGTDDDTYLLPPNGDGIAYSYDEDGQVLATITAENTEWNDLPGDWKLNEAGDAVHLGNDDDFTDEPCVFPVPTQLNADPTPPTCTAPGALDTDALTAGAQAQGLDEDGDLVYEFEHLTLLVDRTVPGLVGLFVYADDGTSLEGLSEAWTVSDDGVFAYRVITLGHTIGFQSSDSEAPCFQQQTATPTPTPTEVTEVLPDDPAPTTSATPVTSEVLASGPTLAATGSNGTLAMAGIALLVLLLGTGGVALAQRR